MTTWQAVLSAYRAAWRDWTRRAWALHRDPRYRRRRLFGQQLEMRWMLASASVDERLLPNSWETGSSSLLQLVEPDTVDQETDIGAITPRLIAWEHDVTAQVAWAESHNESNSGSSLSRERDGTSSYLAHGADLSARLYATRHDGNRTGDPDRFATFSFQDSDDWSSTALSEDGLENSDSSNDPRDLVAAGFRFPGLHGEPVTASDRHAFLGSFYGVTNHESDPIGATRLLLFQDVFHRWGHCSGIEYRGEPNDDSALFGTGAMGSTQIQVDLCWSGHDIDGQTGQSTRSYQFYAHFGDIVIETPNQTFQTHTLNCGNSLFNVVLYEDGNASGIEYLCPVDRAFDRRLAEPFINWNADGPQCAEVLAVQRGDGDSLEKRQRNDPTVIVVLLSTITPMMPMVCGADGPDHRVSLTETGLLAIDDFHFTVEAGLAVNVILKPVGLTYLSHPQKADGSGSAGITFNASASSDATAQNGLALAILAADGTTVFHASSSQGIGLAETLPGLVLPEGTDEVRFTGSADTAQRYESNLSDLARRGLFGSETGGAIAVREGRLSDPIGWFFIAPLADSIQLMIHSGIPLQVSVDSTTAGPKAEVTRMNTGPMTIQVQAVDDHLAGGDHFGTSTHSNTTTDDPTDDTLTTWSTNQPFVAEDEVAPLQLLSPLGSYLAERTLNIGSGQSGFNHEDDPGTPTAGETFIDRAPLLNHARLFLAFLGTSVTDTAPAGEAPRVLPTLSILTSSSATLRVFNDLAISFILPVTWNKTLERLLSDTTTELAWHLSRSALKFGGMHHAVVGEFRPTLSPGPTFDDAQNAAAFVDLIFFGASGFRQGDSHYSSITGATVANTLFPAGDVRFGGQGGTTVGLGHDVPDSKTALSSTAMVSRALVPRWDDLDPRHVAIEETSVDTIPTRFVRWQNHTDNQVSYALDFRLQVFPLRPIYFHSVYPDVRFGDHAYDAGELASMGYQASGSSISTYSFNSVTLAKDQMLDFLQPANAVDVDEDETALRERAGLALDIVSNRLDGGDYPGETLQWIAPNGLTLVTAVAHPVQAGATVTKDQQGMLGNGFPTSGIYVARLTSSVDRPQYGMVVPDRVRSDSEPDASSATPLQTIHGISDVVGSRDATSDLQDRYQISLAGDQSDLRTTANLIHVIGSTSTQSMNLDLSVGDLHGSTVAVSDQYSVADGQQVPVMNVMPSIGTDQFLTQPTSESDEYHSNFVANQTVALLELATDQATLDEGDSETSNLTFTVTRSGLTSGPTTVDYAVTGNGTSPASPSDFVGNLYPYGTISFSAGETTKTINIPIRGELFYENDERFTVTIFNPSADAMILDPVANGTIRNDDMELLITEIMYDPKSSEPSWEWVEIYNPGPADVNLAGWVLEDISTDTVATANIAAGTVTAGRTAVLFNANLTKDAFTSAWGAGIHLIPVVSWSNLTLNNSAGSSGGDRISLWRNFTSYAGDHLNHLNTVVSVRYRNGTEGWVGRNSAGSIYLTNLTLDPSLGSSWALSTAGIAGGYVSSSKGGNSGEDVGSPGLLPGARRVQIVAGAADVDEGQSGDTAFTFQVQRTGELSTVSSIGYVVAGSGSHPADADDFGGNFPAGTITFAQNETTVTLAISVRADLLVESDEGFSVTLISPPALTEIITDFSSAFGTIRNDDSRVSIQAIDAIGNEGDLGTNLFTFSVVRTGAVVAPASVQWNVTGGFLQPADGNDFMGGSFPQGTINFTANESVRTIAVPVQGDMQVEADESFMVSLLNPTGGMQLDLAKADGSIQNDDIDLTIEATNADRAEGNTLTPPTAFTFSIRRNGLVTGSTSVTYTVIGTGASPANAEDFGGTFPSDIVTFSPSETTQVITIPVIGDRLVEPDETFLVMLTNSTGNAELLINSATGMIRNDDTSLRIAATDADKMEGHLSPTSFTFTVTRAGLLTSQSTVPWSVSGQGADPADSADFSGAIFPSGSLVFDAGVDAQTITVQVAGDHLYEPDEGFQITLASPGNASLEVPAADGTIRNDDGEWEIRPLLADRPEDHTGNTPFTFEVIRSGATMSPVNIRWVVRGSGSQPADAADFGGTFPSGELTFNRGEARKEISVLVRGDLAVESDEGFTVTISSELEGHVLLVDTDAEGVIRNDDTGLSLQIVDTQKREGDSGTTVFQVRVARTGLLTGVSSVDYFISGTTAQPANPADFGGSFPSGTVAFAPGQSELLLSIDISGDRAVEADESFQVTLANAVGAEILTATGSSIILNDDINLSIETRHSVLSEGNSGKAAFAFQLIRTGDVSRPTSVNYAVTGSGIFAADATDFGGMFPSGIVTFGIGSTMEMLTIQVSGDQLDEFDEFFTVTLSNPSEAAQLVTATAESLIRNDDSPPTVSLSLDPDSLVEAGGTATITATLSAISGKPIRVDLAFGGTATLDADYRRTGTTINLDPGVRSSTITLTALQDTMDENDETVTILIGSATQVSIGENNVLVVTLRDDDPPPTVTLGLSGSSLAENHSTATLTAMLGAASAKDITVRLVFSGAATDTVDYSRSATSITIPAGSTSGSITITTLPDVLDEIDETVVVDIDSVIHGVESGMQQVMATIIDDDDPPMVTLQLTGSPIAEASGIATLTASLSAVSGKTITVGLTLSGTATITSDYTSSDTAILIPAGSVAGSIMLTALQDMLDESDETIVVDIDSVSNGTESATQQVIATITDDDRPPLVTLGINGSQIAEAVGTATVTATLSAPSGQTVTIQLAFSGTATPTDDYTRSGSTITIPAGSTTGTITLNALQDMLDESDETIVVDIDSVSNGTESATQQVAALISDDDDPPSVSISLTGNSITEAAGTATLTAFLSAISGQSVRVQLSFTGTATLTTDYLPSAMTIFIAAGSRSGSITLNAVQDTMDEPDETIIIGIESATDASESGMQEVTATIVDDDFPEVRIQAGLVDRSEGQTGLTPFTFIIQRIGQVNTTGSVSWTVLGAGNHPVDAFDFGGAIPSGMVSFASGESEKTISVMVSADVLVESDELFHVVLTNPMNLQLGIASVTGTIRNDDLSLAMTAVEASRREGNTGTTRFTFRVNRLGLTDVAVHVSYAVTGLGADAAQPADFVNGIFPSGTIQLAKHETEQLLIIQVATDDVLEADEDFRVTLTHSSIGTVTTATADGRILNDDPQVLLIDDGDALYQQTGPWTRWTVYGGYASDDRVADMREMEAKIGAHAIYRFQNLVPGTAYSLAATWAPYHNRSNQAPYTLTGIEGGLRTILVNQRIAPDDFTERDRLGKLIPFESLGSFMTDATGQVTVTLSSTISGNVIADALKLTPITTTKIELQQGAIRHLQNSSLDLGTFIQGGKLRQTFTVANVGVEDLILQPASTTGAVAIAGSNLTLNQRLSAGQTTTISVELDVNPLGLRSGTLSIPSNDPDQSPFVITLTATTVAALVIDDGDKSGFRTTGAWGHWAGFGGFAGEDRIDDVKESAANSGATATYTFPNLIPGNAYQVSVSWLPYPNRTTQARYQVTGIEGGPQAVVVNQRDAPFGTVQVDRRGAPVDFLPLGQFRVDASGTLVVTLTAAQAGNTIADAIRIAPVPNIEVKQNITTIFPGTPLDLGTRLRGDRVVETLTIMNRGSESLVIQPVLTSGQASVTGPNFTPNQPLAPGASQSIQIQIDSSATGNRTGLVTIFSNDVLMPSFQIPIAARVDAELVIDDGDPSGFQLNGAWSTWVGYGGYAGMNRVGDVRETHAGTGAAVTYLFPGLTPGAAYQVSATWTPFTNRTTQAPYRIQGIVGGTQTVLINQQFSPSGLTIPDQRGTATWFQILGIYTVDASGTLTVVIQAASVGNVIADAISIAFVSGPGSAQAANLSPDFDSTPASDPFLTPSESSLFSDTITKPVVVHSASGPREPANEAQIGNRLDASHLIRTQVELAMLDRWLITNSSTVEPPTVEPMIDSSTQNAFSSLPFPFGVDTPAAEGVLLPVFFIQVRDTGSLAAFQKMLSAIPNAESLRAKLFSANQVDSFSMRTRPSMIQVGQSEFTTTEMSSTVLDVASQTAQLDSADSITWGRDPWASIKATSDDMLGGHYRSRRMLPRRVTFVPLTFEAPRTGMSRSMPLQQPSRDIEVAAGMVPDQFTVDQIFAVWGVARGHRE